MKLVRCLSLLLLVQFFPGLSARAQDSQVVKLSEAIQYQRIGRWDADRLNKILQVDTPAFAGITVTYSPARNAVTLYRVTYASVVPERGNKPTIASGLIAVPRCRGNNVSHGVLRARHRLREAASALLSGAVA